MNKNNTPARIAVPATTLSSSACRSAVCKQAMKILRALTPRISNPNCSRACFRHALITTPIVLVWCWLAGSSQAIAQASFSKADCQDFIGERPQRVTCGFFSLPLNHDAADRQNASNSILIPALIARATGNAQRKAAVLIPGGGGPGSGMGFGYSYEPGYFLESYDTLRQAGLDVVIVDQRGAGLSKPRLSCAESIVAFESLLTRKRTLREELDQFAKAVADCRERLRRQHIAVEHFDTRQSALDFLQIMKALDYPRWHTIATSYATTIAQAMQALQADAFDRVVLDSPVPLHYQHPVTLERTRDAIIGALERCSGSTDCAARYPKLTEKLDAVLEAAARDPYPIRLRVYDSEGKLSVKTAVADDTTLLSIFSTAIYYNEHISELPLVINQLHDGLVQSLNSFTETYWYQATDDTYADGLHLTVHCKERQLLEEQYMASRPEYTQSLSQPSQLLLEAQRQLCQLWGVAKQPGLIPTFESDQHTLILAGGLDPVISVEDIQHTADYYRNALVETVAGAGHSVWYQHACARARVLEFLTSPAQMISASSAADCDARVPGFK